MRHSPPSSPVPVTRGFIILLISAVRGHVNWGHQQSTATSNESVNASCGSRLGGHAVTYIGIEATAKVKAASGRSSSRANDDTLRSGNDAPGTT